MAELTIVYKDHSDMVIKLGSSEQYRNWHWSPQTGNLILKRHCHPGCRLEVPEESIKYVEVATQEHTEEEF